MRGCAAGGTSGVEGDQTALFVDDAVQLVTERGDVKELSLRKGNPAESREAFEALSRGMRPARAKVRLLSGDMEWTATLDAAGLSFSALRLPPTASRDPQGRITDRIFLMEEATAHLERRYVHFLNLRVMDPDRLQADLRRWIQQGASDLGSEEEMSCE
jgi:hypothetical protein